MAHLAVEPSIDDVRSQGLLTIIERLGTLDLTPILVYRIDSVPDAALVLLAWQFDMLAPQWQLGAELGETIDTLTSIDALTNIDRLTSLYGEAGPSDYDSWRKLLKIAIPLHRTRGTPYAIRTALKSLGWTDVTFLEGQASWGGTPYPAAQGWAVFRALINLTAGQTVQPQDAERATSAINFFKPARAWLDSLWFVATPIEDQSPAITDFVTTRYAQHDAAPTPSDRVTAPAWSLTDTLLISPLYNRHFYHSGIAYGASEPAVADSGIVINGVAISAKE